MEGWREGSCGQNYVLPLNVFACFGWTNMLDIDGICTSMNLSPCNDSTSWINVSMYAFTDVSMPLQQQMCVEMFEQIRRAWEYVPRGATRWTWQL